MSFLVKQFELDKRGSTVATEFRGAVATFLTMSYILFVNPDILAAAGVPRESAVACTAAAAGICCILMGLAGNFPVALASGMGLNAVVAYGVAREAGSWQAAMGLVVVEGLLVLLLVLVGLREAVMHAIPRDLRRAIAGGIGLFIALIGAVNAKLVMVPPGTIGVLKDNAAAVMPPVTYGSLKNPEPAVALAGLILIGCLMVRGIRGAILIGIAAATGLALLLGVAHLPTSFHAPSFENAFQVDLGAALKLSLLPLLLSLMMVDFFDTLGTASAIAEQAGLQDEGGRIPRLRRILGVDALSAAIGGIFGASSVTSYIESAAGVAEGARTGLHSVFVGLFFLAAIFAAPLAGIVPSAATTPALIVVGFLMCAEIGRIEFKRLETGIPAFIILAAIPFTYSIAHGIGLGFICYVAIQLLAGRFREVHPLMVVVAVAFATFLIWGG